MTNYDRIKNMSVEELAVSLMCPADIDCTFKKPKCCEGNNCCECTLEWLESEETENESYKGSSGKSSAGGTDEKEN